MIASVATILALVGTVAPGPAPDGVDSRELDVLAPSHSVEVIVAGLSCPFFASAWRRS